LAHIRSLILLLAGLLSATHCHAQVSETESIPNPFRSRLLSFHGGLGVQSYLCDAGSSRLGTFWRAGGMLYIMPEIGFAISCSSGKLAYTRTPDPTAPELYRFQFGSDQSADRTTQSTIFDLLVMLNLFPRSMLNVYLEAGAGWLIYSPEDYALVQTRYRPRTENLHAPTVLGGVGAEYSVLPVFSVFLDARYSLFFAKDIDAYDPGAISSAMTPPPVSSPAAAHDAALSFSAGLRWFPFSSDDYDADMLPNSVEDSIGTKPFDPDTDKDKLGDGEEVLVYKTDPRREDSDDDGLGDYTEIIVSHTNPNAQDTDTDGLSDFDEVKRYKTDPNKSDTDDDLLTDFEEIMFYSTDPLNPDTDCDGLMDGTEVKTYLTDPLKPDTDDDGLGDFAEIFTTKTNPRSADSDSDTVTDFEEVRYFSTNPLVTDTDGDGLSDAYELLTLGTNPLRQDTDRDNLPDNVDPNPLLAGNTASEPRRSRTTGKPVVDTTTFFGQKTLLVNINFDFAKYIIKPEYFSLLESYASVFLQLARVTIEIRGHTDFEGTEQFNQALSDNRAKAVRDFLIRRGVSAARIKATGFGERFPLAQCQTEECKALNRRVEFILEDQSDPDSHKKASK
jgi:outer membrane protein OmpA-like peptidoglycan-associated protein